MAAVPVAPHGHPKIRKVAVLTDFSENAEHALRFAARIARRVRANIVLAHADIPPTYIFAAPEVKLVYDALAHWRERLRHSLLNLTNASYLQDIGCTIWVHEGSARELLKDLRDADLIVVGTSGKTGLQKITLGSTAEEIFRSSAIPVLTVGPHCSRSGTDELRIKTVLYAADFSAGADAALAYAQSIAGEHDASLILLHVLNDNDAPFSFERTMASAEPLEKLRRLIPDSPGLKCTTKFVIGFGAPAAVIVEEAAMRNASVIVMGDRGAGAFASAVSHFRGGTAYRVVANADCPVLTVRKIC
jgi:nucleotide-binding universal stress UspA family protein